ncbi:MAG: hypothetical protein HQL37_16060 [Alphaproteobacteria bacterium]|nr:hypothetical protein [Alphaproteobacteria bacterium]
MAETEPDRELEPDPEFLAVFAPGLPARLDDATHGQCFEAALQAVEDAAMENRLAATER